MAKIGVLIVDDHAVLRAGIRMLIDAQPDLQVVGDAGSGQEAVHAVSTLCNSGLCPDVVTLDLGLSDGNGLQIVEPLRRECPNLKVLVLTMHSEPVHLRRSIEAGCAGFLAKAAADTELLVAIRAVHQGRTFVDLHLGHEPLAQDLGLDPAPPVAKPDAVLASLSAREREVLGLLARGHSSREVAERLFLSVKTVETYRARLAQKLRARSRAELVRLALQAGLLDRGSDSAADQPLP